MNKKDIITIIITTLILTALIGGCLFLASRHRFESKNDSTVFSYFTEHKTLMEYNALTESVRKVCGHSTPNDECPLENVISKVQVYENKVYFHRMIGYVRAISCCDPKTSEVFDITDVKNEVFYDLGDNFAVGDGYVFYNEDGNIFRVPVSGGESRLVHKLQDDLEQVIAVADGKLFTATYANPFSSTISFTEQIFAYDLKSFKKREIYSFVSPIMSSSNSNYQYYNGHLYMMLTPEIRDGNQIYGKTNLYRINTKTERVERIIDTEIVNFVVSNNKIYYFPYEERTVITPSVTYEVYIGDSIWTCSTDGKNSRVVYTNPDIIFEDCRIVGGKFFGFCSGSCPEIGINGGQFYCTIDFNTQKVKKIAMPD